MKMTISVGTCMERKTMLVWVKEFIIKNFATCQSLCNLPELYTAFKEKHPKCKYWVLKVLCLEVQMMCSGWLKDGSLCLRLLLSSKYCAASRCNGLGFDIQRPDQEHYLQHKEQKMHYASVWILSLHCNFEIISWSGTQQTSRWWEI